MAAVDYPHNGEYHPAPRRLYQEVILLVPFYEGHPIVLKRHVELLNELGFDVVTFELEQDFSLKKPPLTREFRFGLKHFYAQQIEDLLNLIPGPKIVFSFSNPSASAIEALARRHCADVKALVCDSGPSWRLVRSIFQLYFREKKEWILPVRVGLVPALSVTWSPRLHQDLAEDLSQFPKDFPILSIRGWKDPLIAASHIDEVFEPHANLDWRKLSLPQAAHLNGLRDFRDDYVPAVEKFLKSCSTPISESAHHPNSNS